MANVIIDDTNLTNIANAIRGKNGTQTTYLPSEMATAITNIPSGGGNPLVNDWYNSKSPITMSSRSVSTAFLLSKKAHIDYVGNYRIYYSNATSNDVGDYLKNHITYIDTTAQDYFVWLGDVISEQQQQTPAPTDTKPSTYLIKYQGLSSYQPTLNIPSDISQTIMNSVFTVVDKDGKILGVYTKSDFETAVGSGLISASNGIAVYTNTVASTTTATYQEGYLYFA